MGNGSSMTFHRESDPSKFPLTTCSDSHNTARREAAGEEGECPELELVCLRPEPTVTEQEGRPEPNSSVQVVKVGHLSGF